MTVFNRVAAMFCLIAAMGCANMQTASSPSTAPATPAAADVGLEASGATLGSLPEAAIPSEACGMILWTLNAQRPTPVFRFISGERGEINLGGRLMSLDLVNVGGASGFGVFEDQTFRSEDGLELEVSARFGVGFEGGAYMENGLLKISDPSGWSVVTPAAGIAGCR